MPTVLQERSDIKRLMVSITAIVATADGGTEEVPMGVHIAAPKAFSSGSHGFYLGGKLPDPSSAGQENGVRYQAGFNVVAVGSKNWNPLPRVTSTRTAADRSASARKSAATRAANKAAKAATQ